MQYPTNQSPVSRINIKCVLVSFTGSLGGRGGAPTGVWFTRDDNQPQGSATTPWTLGQAGGGTGAGAGGGMIKVISAGAIEHEGWISADGEHAILLFST